ncbi:MAG: hypothetical protein M1817_001825 [Caeruleum heppii]|nr:MAG: hypothetical protein M1817_001825 [Caeruleum heppii]
MRLLNVLRLNTLSQQSLLNLRSVTTHIPRQSTSPLSIHRRSASSSSGISGPNPKPGENPFKVWPFVAIFAAGSGTYVYMVKSRLANMPPPPIPQNPTPPQPTFTPPAVLVTFVLGGPGSGKGTQCAKLVDEFGFTHLSAGDLLRAEQDREGSEVGELIRGNIKEGIVVPMEITVGLLETAMKEALTESEGMKEKGQGMFLIDGFPRKMDQALHFESSVCPSLFTLFFACPEDILETRLLNRGKSSGRADDNIDSIKKRFKVFVETSMPVVEYFEKEGKVERVDATRGVEEVYRETRERVLGRLRGEGGRDV